MPPSIPHIDADAALEKWEEDPEGVILLDCREDHELDIARIENAVHVPMSEITERHGEIDRSKRVIVFCHRGIRSLSVAAFLKQQGFEWVRSMTGGIDAWSTVVDETVPRY